MRKNFETWLRQSLMASQHQHQVYIITEELSLRSSFDTSSHTADDPFDTDGQH